MLKKNYNGAFKHKNNHCTKCMSNLQPSYLHLFIIYLQNNNIKFIIFLFLLIFYHKKCLSAVKNVLYGYASWYSNLSLGLLGSVPKYLKEKIVKTKEV